MNKQLYALHAQLCETLANPKRLEILDALRQRALSVGELMKKTGIPQSNLSQHLALLRQRGIVRAKRDGRSILYSLAYPEMVRACAIVQMVVFKQLKEGEKLAKRMRG